MYAYKTQSQEDLDRISRVTSDAPIMETGCTNSLGRRTIASLQQIERNRQLHLAQQGLPLIFIISVVMQTFYQFVTCIDLYSY